VTDRPRDRLGRPLPPGRPDEHLPLPELPPEPGGVLALAQQLLDAGRPFEAHEVLEEQWKRTEGPDRVLWRALAQLCVAYTHQLRGNPVGARRLAERSADLLHEFTGPVPGDLDRPGLIAYARALQTSEASEPPRLCG
jgi:uncharacterized protein